MAPTNIYIDNFNNNPEQKLIESLIVESIKFNGKDFYYLPRKASTQFDTVYGEDPGKFYDEAHLIEMYVQNVEGWGGERDTITNFGLEIREEMTLIVAMRRFNDLLSEQKHLQPIMTRPREGDLLYFNFQNSVSNIAKYGTFLEIKFVEHESIFYQLGSLQVYEIRCETLRYSNEVFRTGIVDIDQAFALNYSDYINVGNTMPSSTKADNQSIETEAETYLDTTEISPFGDFQ